MNASAPPRSQPPTIASSRSRRSARRTASPTFQASTSPVSQYGPIPSAALHAPGGAFNVDPGAPFLGSAASHVDVGPSSPTSSRRNSKNFVGGFVSVVKKVMGQQGVDQAQRHPEEGHLFNSLPADGREQNAHPPPATSVTHTGSIHNDLTYISPVSSSHTHHDSLESQTNDEGATLVGHEVLPTAQVLGSPVSVEPRPGSDYAKMDSPRHSITSLASYAFRIRKFFQDLNALPWIADRVTVDYIPGKERGRRHIRPTSWYGGVAQPGHLHSVDLFSDTTSSESMAARQAVLPTLPYSTQPQVIFRIQSPNAQTANLPYAHVVPASYSIGPSAPPVYPTYTMPPAPFVPQDRPRVAIQSPHPTPSSEPTTQRQHTPQPVPQVTPAQSPPIAAFRPYGETFPLGYVPYQQQAAVAEEYGDLSVHGLSHVPRMVSSTSGTATQPSRPVSSRTQPSRPVSDTATPRASRPPSAAGNSRSHTPHTPAAFQYPYPVTTTT